MFITAFLSIAGLGFICWLLFNLAVYALPFCAGVSAGMAAYETGAGPIGAILVGLVAAAVTLVVGQFLFAKIRSPAVRAIIAVLFAAPAALAGYHAVHGLTGVGETAEVWRQAFGVIAAVIIGFVAWSRVSAFYPGNSAQGVRTATRPVALRGRSQRRLTCRFSLRGGLGGASASGRSLDREERWRSRCSLWRLLSRASRRSRLEPWPGRVGLGFGAAHLFAVTSLCATKRRAVLSG